MKSVPLLLCALCALCGSKAMAAERPNIILIWDALRQERLERQRAMGLVDPS